MAVADARELGVEPLDLALRTVEACRQLLV
jgi:hypothetical protein